MGAGTGLAARLRQRPLSLRRRPERVEPATAAWLLALPCAGIAIALLVLLGRPVSTVLYPPASSIKVLLGVPARPEPVEDTRYLLALSGPLLLAAGLVGVAPRLRLTPGVRRAGLVLAQALGAGVVLACLVKQRERGWQLSFFAGWQLVVAAPAAAGLAWAAVRGWLTRARDEPRPQRIAIGAFVVLITALWFLPYLNTERSIWWSGDPLNSGYLLDEAAAVLNGLTPLVDFSAGYGSLTAYPLALWLLLFGKTLLSYTFAMWALSVATLLAIYGVLRHTTRSAAAALALYLPVMAFSFLAAVGDVHHPAAIFQELPMRPLGPFLLAWLLARRLHRGRGRTWPLFLVGGLVVLNNTEFGTPALVGAVAALCWAATPRTRREAARLAGSVAAGLLAAGALVCALTLIRAGALPDLRTATAFARIFGVAGVALTPLPHLLGLPLVIFLTYAAAIAVATVRALRREPDRALTGMLVWTAVYGFGSGTHYVGESLPTGMLVTFTAWSLALALLAVVAVRQLAHARPRLPGPAALAVLFGIALIGTYVLLPPPDFTPWARAHRISTRPASALRPFGAPNAVPHDPRLVRFLGSVPDARGRLVVRRGAPVALVFTTGHLLADAYGLRDVVPFVGEQLYTVEQLDDALARLRAAGGSTLLIGTGYLREVADLLVARGFAILTRHGFRRGLPGRAFALEAVAVYGGLTKWTDAPRAIVG
jgi:hypothetical protein